MPERIVVTGLGLVSPLGQDTAQACARLASGEYGLRRLEGTLAADYPGLGFGRVEADLLTELGGKGWRHQPRAALMACRTARLALREAGVDAEGLIAADEAGVSLGASNNYYSSPFCRELAAADLTMINPAAFTHVTNNLAASQVSIFLGWQAFAHTVSTGFLAGIEAIGHGWTALAAGRAGWVLAGGVEEQTPELIHALTLGYADQEPGLGDLAVETWRAGAVTGGEGCGLLLLETESHARARSARPKAVLEGFGLGFCPTARTADPRAATSAMRAAMDQAQISPSDIGAVFLSANGNPMQDRSEALALREIFGGQAPLTVAVKSAWGESFHAGGAMAAVAAVACLDQAVWPKAAKPFSAGEAVARSGRHDPSRSIRRVMLMSLDNQRAAACLMIALPV